MKKIHRNRKLLELYHTEKYFVKGKKEKFHFENISFIKHFTEFMLSLSGFKKKGISNALDILVNEKKFIFRHLPSSFDGFRILFLSDLHIDCNREFEKILAEKISNLDYDLCILGGDYRFHAWGNDRNALKKMEYLLKYINSPIYGILGNHDIYSFAEDLERLGVKMLINESKSIERNGEKIYFTGVDDCHYFEADDLEGALENIPENSFKILLSHSPELFRKAEKQGFKFYLCGHTHGGQICMPGEIPVITNTYVPNDMIKGRWHYKKMEGYTSRGVGTSCVPVRFNSKGEILIAELCKIE